jgi:hypothetical protein
VWARKPWRLQPWRARWMEKSLDMENTNFFSRFGTHRPQHHSLPCMTLHNWPWKSLDSGGGCDHRQLKVLQQPQPRTSNDKWGAASVRSFIHITASMCQCGRWLVWCGIWRLRTHTHCLPTTCFAFAHFCPSLSQRHIQSILVSVAHAHHHAVCVAAVAPSLCSSSQLLARCHHEFALPAHLDLELL